MLFRNKMTLKKANGRSGRQALCLSGHLRHPRFGPGEEIFSGDVFVATWDVRDTSTRIADVGLEEINATYGAKMATVENSTVVARGLKRKCAWIDSRAFVAYKNRRVWETYSLFYLMRRANELRCEYEMRHGFTYDVVVRARPDAVFRGLPGASPEAGCIYSPHNSYYAPEGCEAKINDNLFFGDSPTMEVAMSVYDFLDFYMMADDCPWTKPGFHNESLFYHHLKKLGLAPRQCHELTYRKSEGKGPGREDRCCPPWPLEELWC